MGTAVLNSDVGVRSCYLSPLTHRSFWPVQASLDDFITGLSHGGVVLASPLGG